VSLDSLEELARITTAVDTAVQEHVARVCFYIIENETQVGDD
jgi:hypothetical protein